MECMGKPGYLRCDEEGVRIPGVKLRNAITPVIVFVVACFWLGLLSLPRVHSLWIALLGVLSFPVYLVRNPWNSLTAALLANLALAVLVGLVIWAKRRLLRRPH